jgi:hypothetical protein
MLTPPGGRAVRGRRIVFQHLYSQPQFTVWPGVFPACVVKFSWNKPNDSCENLPSLWEKSLGHPAVSVVNTGSQSLAHVPEAAGFLPRAPGQWTSHENRI